MQITHSEASNGSVNLLVNEKHPEFESQFHSWCVDEWGKITPLHAEHNNQHLPFPIYVIHNDVLIGGLVFTWSLLADTTETKLWINAIIVAPDQRKKELLQYSSERPNTWQKLKINLSCMPSLTFRPCIKNLIGPWFLHQKMARRCLGFWLIILVNTRCPLELLPPYDMLIRHT